MSLFHSIVYIHVTVPQFHICFSRSLQWNSPIISDPKLKFQLTMLAGIRNMTKFPDAAASFWVGIKKCDALGSIQAKQISPRLCHPAFEMSTTVRKPKTTGQHAGLGTSFIAPSLRPSS